MKADRILIAALLLLALCLSACGTTSGAPGAAPAQSAEPVQELPPELDTALPIRVLSLNGTTGFGLAPLMARAQAGETELNYSFAVETDASNVTAALVSGDCDLAALPTNAAAALYNKTGGKIQVLALNTRGVLYLVSDGSVELNGIADLAGQTVFAPAQNPSFILRHLCQANGLDVEIDNSFAQPAELNAAAASGQTPLAVLPEPMVTIARSQNPQLQVALDLTEEWDKVAEPGSLVQGCLAVSRDFAQAHPAELAQFLADYQAAVDLVLSDPAAAAQMIQDAGVFPQAAVAEKALPRCNICFVTGEQMQRQLSAFLEIMAETAPESIGGALPGEDFYCVLP